MQIACLSVGKAKRFVAGGFCSIYMYMMIMRYLGMLSVLLLLSALNGVQAAEEFGKFLERFVSSASFQYERVKFPLKSPIVLLKDDGETEVTFPFTREKWPLLNADNLKEGRFDDEEGGVFIARFTRNETTYKEFEAGYEESEQSLRVVFELIDGLWYVTDCYTDWYNCELPIEELEETVSQVQEENRDFEAQHP